MLLSAALLLAGAASAVPAETAGLLAALGLVLGLGAAGLSLSRRLLPDLAAPSRWTSALVLAAALAVVPATVLGHLGLLAPRPFLGLEALLILALSFLPGPAPERPGAAAPEAAELRTAPWIERSELTLLAVAGLAAAVSLVSFATRVEPYAPPTKLDDPSYHLPAVAVWNRFHDLRMIKFDAGDRSTTFYPIGAELIDWALLAPLRESDFLARWGQLPFALGSLIALAAIARRLQLSSRAAFLAVLLDLTVSRAFPDLAFSAGNDHVTSFYTLAAADAILLFGGAQTLGAAAYLGITFGLLLGVKYVGLLNALPLLVLLAAAAGRPRGGLKAGARELALFGACAFAAGGYTYLRNAWSVGNPVFPAPVAFLGLPGWREVTLEVRRHLPEFQIDAGQFLLVRTGYFGHLFRFTMLPAAVLAPLVSLFQKGGWRERIVRALLLSLPVVFFLQFLYQIHDHRDIRYFFAAVALAAVAFVWLLQRAEGVRPWLPPLVRSGLAVLVAYKFIHTDETTWVEELTSAWGLLLIAGVSVAAWPYLRERLAGRRTLLAVLGCGLAVFAAVRLAGPLEKYEDGRYQFDPVAGYLDARSGRDGLTLAYAGGNCPYALFGSRLRNRVEIVPRDGPLEDRYYAWGGSARFPFDHGNYRQWRENLRRLGVQYVVLETGEDQDPERPWMRKHPLDFERVYDFGAMEVWRLAGRSPQLRE